jgi:L-fuculose-phosphate aldolase
MNIEKARGEVILSGRELVEKGLVARTWGNVSCRVDGDLFVITPSGISYERLTPELIVPVRIEDGSYEGSVKPSSEKGIHAAVYAAFPETNFIIHTHQTCATCVSVFGIEGLSPSEAQLKLLGGPVKLAGYAMPGTAKLRNNVLKVLPGSGGVVLMERHGVLIAGPSREVAFERAALVEDVCGDLMPDYTAAAIVPALSVTRGEASPIRTRRNYNGLLRRSAPRKDGAEDICGQIFASRPDVSAICLLDTPAIRGVIRRGGKAPAMIDDFAQMVGIDGRIAEPGRAARGLAGRNAVFVPGFGAFCCAGTMSDCEALMALTEKNALAIMLVSGQGKVRSIPFLERRIMRWVYVKKYSKMK